MSRSVYFEFKDFISVFRSSIAFLSCIKWDHEIDGVVSHLSHPNPNPNSYPNITLTLNLTLTLILTLTNPNLNSNPTLTLTLTLRRVTKVRKWTRAEIDNVYCFRSY